MPERSPFNFKFRLLSEGRNEEYETVLTPGRPYTIGRQGAGLQLFDPSVSRIHCHFLLDGEKVFVGDDGSTNGTYIDGMRVLHDEVVQGTVIQLGVYTIQVLETPASIRAAREAAKPEAPIPVRRRALVDELELTFGALQRALTEAILRPHQFFEETSFDGQVGRSLTLIAGSLLLSNSLGQLLGVQTLPAAVLWIVVSTALGILMIMGLAFTLDFAHKILESEARYSSYLRFFAFAAMLSVLGQVLTTLTFGFAGPLVGLLLLVWIFLGLVKAFEAAPLPLVGVLVAFGLLWVVVSKFTMSLLFHG